jgi:signal transduction histidine kinase
MEHGKPTRVLYVEDDRDLAMLVKERLSQAGFVVELAFDGAETLAKCAAGAYDLLALDQTLPGRDGLGVLRAIADRGPVPPTVMVTGTGNERLAVQTLKLGADDYVIKDLDGGWLDLLPGIIERVLDHRRLLEERQLAEAALREAEALAREHRTLKHLLEQSDHERQIIACEIHDGLAQYLAGAMMLFQAFDHLRETDFGEASKAFDAGTTMLRQAHAEARRLISGGRSPVLDEEGVLAAVTDLVNELRQGSGPAIEFRAETGFDRLAPVLENAIYRVVQEALTNACRHSGAKEVHVELVQHGDQIRVEVRDRGHGFSAEDVGEGRFGLAGIRQRARLLGGTAIIESEVGAGTRVVVDLPIVVRTPENGERRPLLDNTGHCRISASSDASEAK